MALALAKNSTSYWQELLLEAGQHIHIHLSTDEESYLVFLLMRYCSRSDWIQNAMALSFLESAAKQSSAAFQEVGDQCLLLSGFFPARARNRNIPLSYWITLGQSAYASVAQDKVHQDVKLFLSLSKQFVLLVDLLLQIRRDHHDETLTLLEALTLYSDTHSRVAKEIVEQSGKRIVKTNNGIIH